MFVRRSIKVEQCSQSCRRKLWISKRRWWTQHLISVLDRHVRWRRKSGVIKKVRPRDSLRERKSATEPIDMTRSFDTLASRKSISVFANHIGNWFWLCWDGQGRSNIVDKGSVTRWPTLGPWLKAGLGCCKHAVMACNRSEVNSPALGIASRFGKLADETLDVLTKVEFSEKEAVDNTQSKLSQKHE